MKLRWARTSGRHIAHLITKDFARPSHGEFVERRADDHEYNAICGTVFVVNQLDTEPSWKFCKACLAQLGELIEQTMPEES